MSKPHFSVNRGFHLHPPLWTHNDSESEIPKALIRSARHGEIDNVKLLLDQGADIEEKNVDGWTALFAATSAGHVDIVRLLLERGSKMMRFNDDTKPTLDSPVEARNPPLCAASDCVDIHGYTVLMIAVFNDHTEVVKLLLDVGADPNSGYDPIFRTERNTSMALIIAASRGNIEIMTLLLNKEAIIDGVNFEDNTALTAATINGNVQAVQLLLDKGATTDRMNTKHATAFMVAVSINNIEIVKLLLDKAATADMHETSVALIVASYFGSIEIVELILTKGAVINGVRDDQKAALTLSKILLDQTIDESWNITPLIASACRGHTEVVKLLLDRGALIDITSTSGWTALMFAATCGHFSVAEVLLDSGASMEITNNKGITALMFAAGFDFDIARLLLDRGAAIDRGSGKGMTALMFAAARDIEILKLLLSRGANVDSKDIEGRTAFMIAFESHRMDAMMLLLDSGAHIYNEWC